MICNLCGVNDATIHMTEIQNHQMMEIHLCEACAQEKGTEFKTHFNIKELFSGFGDPSLLGALTEKVKIAPTCPQCGLTYDELSKTGRLGCSVCYQSFDQVVSSLIRRVQRAVHHTGKVPRRMRGQGPKKERTSPAQDLLLLQQRLKQCIQNEKFEEAAQLRDEIQRFEEKIKKPAKPGPKRAPK